MELVTLVYMKVDLKKEKDKNGRTQNSSLQL